MSFGTFSARSPAAKNVRHKPEAHTNAYSPLSNTDWIVRKKTLQKFERKFADCKNLHRYFGISA